MGWYPPASACGPPPLSPGARSLRHWRGAGDLNSWGKVEAHAGAAGKLALQPGICGQDRLGVGAMLRACRARSASGVRPCKGLGHATRPKSTRSRGQKVALSELVSCNHNAGEWFWLPSRTTVKDERTGTNVGAQYLSGSTCRVSFARPNCFLRFFAQVETVLDT